MTQLEQQFSQLPQSFTSPEQQHKLPQTFQDSSARVHKKRISTREFEMPLLGSIVLEGKFMPASAMYGCFMTMAGSYCLNAKLPDNFRVSIHTACFHKIEVVKRALFALDLQTTLIML